jgi:hypothetical protein
MIEVLPYHQFISLAHQRHLTGVATSDWMTQQLYSVTISAAAVEERDCGALAPHHV